MSHFIYFEHLTMSHTYILHHSYILLYTLVRYDRYSIESTKVQTLGAQSSLHHVVVDTILHLHDFFSNGQLHI